MTKGQRETQFRKELRDRVGNRCSCCHEVAPYLQFSHTSRGNKYRTKHGRARDFSRLSVKQMKRECHKGTWECLICAAVNTRIENEDMPAIDTHRARIRRRQKQVRQEFVNGIKLTIGKCSDCVRLVTPSTFCAFDFDHLNASRKIAKLSTLVSSLAPISVLRAEIDKCELVCKLCHAARTVKRRVEGFLTPTPQN